MPPSSESGIEYCGRALRGEEERYPKMEKLVLALVTTVRRLRPYFQAHTIEISTEYPMKQILHKLETSGRLVKWAIELSEFDIRYKLITAVQVQILAYFIMEFTLAEPTETVQLASDPPYLEVVCRWGRQCPRKRSRVDSDLLGWDRRGICTQIWIPSLQQRS